MTEGEGNKPRGLVVGAIAKLIWTPWLEGGNEIQQSDLPGQ